MTLIFCYFLSLGFGLLCSLVSGDAALAPTRRRKLWLLLAAFCLWSLSVKFAVKAHELYLAGN